MQTKPYPSDELNYRPDIDGLRGVAVISVILFHVAPSWFEPGFLGVDVFFVISGFLITRIILFEIGNNSFSVMNFYQRRIIRIFPALIVVLLACLVLGWFLSPSGHYELLGKHVIASSGFISNLLLWSEAGYFDSVSITKPLLHLWSLGVEEQFYICWPIILIVLWRFKLNIISSQLLFIVLSLCFAFLIAKGNPVSFFYLPITRAWELLMGGALAYFYVFTTPFTRQIPQKINHRFKLILLSEPSQEIDILRNVISFVGLVLVGISFYKIGTGASFKPEIAVFAVFGTCCVIAVGPKAIFNNYILSNKVLVSIGLISYPLYLWHWPLLSFSKFINLPPSTEVPLVFVAFILSWLTYKFIERPFRFSSSKKRSAFILIGGMLVPTVCGYIIFSNNGIPMRYETHDGQYNLSGSLKKDKYVDYKLCDGAPNVVDSWCWEMKNPSTILIGDSHIDQLKKAFAENGFDQFSSLVSLGAGNCPPLLHQDQPEERCTKQIRHTLSQLKYYPTLKYAIISSWNTEYGDPDKAVRALIPVIEKLRDEGIKVAMIVDNPTLKKSPSHCLLSWPPLKIAISGPPKYCENPSANDFEPYFTYSEFIEKVQLAYPDMFVFNPLPLFCRGSVCDIRTGSIMNYADEGHLSDFMGKKVVNSFVEAAKTRGF